MAESGLSARQTVLVAVFAVVAAIIIGTLLFLGDIDSFLTQIGR